jgi:hypothetical protein
MYARVESIISSGGFKVAGRDRAGTQTALFAFFSHRIAMMETGSRPSFCFTVGYSGGMVCTRGFCDLRNVGAHLGTLWVHTSWGTIEPAPGSNIQIIAWPRLIGVRWTWRGSKSHPVGSNARERRNSAAPGMVERNVRRFGDRVRGRPSRFPILCRRAPDRENFWPCNRWWCERREVPEEGSGGKGGSPED